MYCQLEHSMVAAGESMPIKAGVVGCCLIIYVDTVHYRMYFSSPQGCIHVVPSQ